MIGRDFWLPVSPTVLPRAECYRLRPVCRLFEAGFGRVLVAAVEGGVCAVFFEAGGHEAVADFKSRFRHADLRFGDSPHLDAVAGLFASPPGLAGGGAALPVVVCGSGFRVAVWEAVLRIPFGATASYSDVAAAVGCPGAARAVGVAVGCNPLPLVVPCHRVVGASGRLGGFRWGVEVKRRILAWEAGCAPCRN